MPTALRLFRVSLAMLALGVAASHARAQAVGPDMVNSSLIDVARYGTDVVGGTTAYAVGSVSCNRGDVAASVRPTDPLIRILVAQDLYRLKTYGTAPNTYQRMEHVGQGWVKRVNGPISVTQASCGPCQSSGSGMLGVNCGDPYGTGLNGSQGTLGPRSLINAPLGTTTGSTGTATGDATIRGRVQVPTLDVVNQPAGTRFFAETVHLLRDDAQYVRPGATVAVNALNNAATQEININNGTGTPTLLGGVTSQLSGVERWKQIDPAVVIVNVDDDSTPNTNPASPGTFIRTRFQVAGRATSLGGGLWRYEYAIFNLNSDRGAGAFTLPLDLPLPVNGLALHHPLAHSGEPYSNTPWAMTRSTAATTFATDPYVINANANAVRWGTTYNIGFTTTTPPRTGSGQLTLFRPGSGPALLEVPGLPIPGVSCSADFNNDGSIGADADIEAFFACLSGNCCATCPANADFNGDGDVGTDADIESFFRVLAGGAC